MNTGPLVSKQKKKPAPASFREIEQRLEHARASVERIWTPSAEEVQRVLKIRALALARESSPEETAHESIELVEFTLAYERYAVESRHVRQVASLENLTPLPCTPAFMLGVVNVRGEIIPVIDLRKFFELPEKGLTDLNKVIVLQTGKIFFGILADAIVSVRNILMARIQPSLPTLTDIRKYYLKGVDSERLVILDAEKLLMDDSIIVQEQVVEQ